MLLYTWRQFTLLPFNRGDHMGMSNIAMWSPLLKGNSVNWQMQSNIAMWSPLLKGNSVNWQMQSNIAMWSPLFTWRQFTLLPFNRGDHMGMFDCICQFTLLPFKRGDHMAMFDCIYSINLFCEVICLKRPFHLFYVLKVTY
jgi:hypothetical protein